MESKLIKVITQVMLSKKKKSYLNKCITIKNNKKKLKAWKVL